jgi:hypothetical protein
MTSPEELQTAFALARMYLDRLEERLGNEDPAKVRLTLIKVIGSLRSHGRPERVSDKPPRGVGYGQMGPDGYTTPDDAMIIASLPWFKGNMSAAIRAHYPEADPDKVRVHARRIRDHQREIVGLIGNDNDLPWEGSDTWLGDLPKE